MFRSGPINAEVQERRTPFERWTGTDKHYSSTKYINVRQHFVRGNIFGGSIDISYIRTALMVANALTIATSNSKLGSCSFKKGLFRRKDVGKMKVDINQSSNFRKINLYSYLGCYFSLLSINIYIVHLCN